MAHFETYRAEKDPVSVFRQFELRGKNHHSHHLHTVGKGHRARQVKGPVLPEEGGSTRAEEEKGRLQKWLDSELPIEAQWLSGAHGVCSV